MKKLVVAIVFFVVLFSIACAEGKTPHVATDVSDDFVKLSIAMLASFGAGLVVAFGYKKK